MADSNAVGAVWSRLGRTSLLGSSNAPTTVPASSDTASSNLGKNLGLSFDVTYGGTGLGRLTAGMAGVIVLALVGFYIVTRSHQA